MQKPKPESKARNETRLRIGIALIGVLAVGLVTWLVLSGDDDSTANSSGEAEIVSVESLREATGGQGTPVYWAGEQGGTEIELSQPEKGRTYVRYLSGDAEAGDPRRFLTVGTYVTPDPVAALQRQGQQPGGVLGKAPGGATIYFDRDRPQSVYLAYPGVEAQIEVYDPDFRRALQLVNSGQIVSTG